MEGLQKITRWPPRRSGPATHRAVEHHLGGRHSRRPSVGVEDTATRSALAPADGADGGSVRLALIDPPAVRTTLDGAWWPRTRDLTQELPALVEELDRRGIRVARVAYNP
ncbi:MAG TPA: DUF5994 family protein, partial [Pseudonocardiaceae bacterium]|nr:DUF5994 family protein [Pseudonocardiaceae bacterium]